METPGAVVVGGHINGLGIIRALAARKIPTAVVTTEPFDIAHRSRWISAHADVPSIDEKPELLVELLERRASDWPGWALFPANDGAMAALSKYHDRLSSSHRVIAPPWEVAHYFLDKVRMLNTAQAVGMKVPHCYGLAEGAMASRQDLHFPVIVKPVEGYRFFARFRCKLFLARTREELGDCIARVSDARLSCQVFDVIPGPDSQIYAYCTYIDKSGEPAAGVTVRKLRQSPPMFGVARVVEVVENMPALSEPTVELLRRIGFRGIAAAEFKLDSRDGSFRFLEVNGRSVIYNRLLRRAGLDLGALAWADYVEGRPEPARPNGWPGVWVNLHADILHSIFSRRAECISFADYLAPYARPMIEAVWSVRDPLPFLTQWSGTAASVVRKGR